MLFGRNIFSLPLGYNLAPVLVVCESPSSSDYRTQLLDFELVALSSILSVDDNCNAGRSMTFNVHLLRNCCTRIWLMVTADINRLSRS